MLPVPPQPLPAGMVMPAGLPVAGVGALPGTELPPNTPLSGKIKAWYEDKSYGFITPDLPGPDIFVHKNQLTETFQLQQGTLVIFQCRYNPGRGKYEVTSCQFAGGAQPAADAAQAPGKGTAPPKGGWAVQDNLFIAGMPMTATEEWVKDFFSKYGTVAQCKVLPDQPGKLDKAALVRFAEETQAKWVVENLNGTTPEGLSSPLTVRFAGDRTGGAKGQPAAAAFGAAPTAAAADPRFSPYGAVGSTVPLAVPGAQAMFPGFMNPALLPGFSLGGMGLPGSSPTIGDASSIAGFANPLAAQPIGGADPALAGVLQGYGQTAPAAMVAQPGMPTSPGTQPGDAWLEAKDPASGRSYYYHAVTREVRWDKPA